jgi:hypothetical protein
MPPRFSFNIELTSSVNAPIYDDEKTLANFMKQSTQQQRGKRRNKRKIERERESKSKLEGQNPKWVTIGTNHVFEGMSIMFIRSNLNK